MKLNNFKRTVFLVLVGILLFYATIYIDIFFRARSAYLEAEKYFDWYKNPQKKQQFFLEKYNKEKKQLDLLLLKNKIDKKEYDLKLELLDFKITQEQNESSLKYAYVWYKTAIELFSPPETKWIKLSKEKIEPVKQLWKKELESKGYKIEDYMVE